MFKKILFCTDFSENPDHGFSYASDLARAYDARLLILHAIVDPVCYHRSTPKGAIELIANLASVLSKLKAEYVNILNNIHFS